MTARKRGPFTPACSTIPTNVLRVRCTAHAEVKQAVKIGIEDERMNIGVQMSRDCRSVEGNIVCISIRVSVKGYKNLCAASA